MRNALAAVLSTLLLAGCAGSTATSGPPSSAPATVAPASAAPTAAPASPTAVPVALFTFGKDAVVTTAISGTTDLYVNPGAVIESDGVLHMFANNFSTWPGHMTIPHLTSTDGIAWTLDPEAKALDSDDFKLADPGIDVSTGYLADDGTWVLYYETVSATNPWVVGRATARSPKGPWTIGQKPVLQGGAGVTAPLTGFSAVYAISNNTRRFWNLDDTLGYRPVDDAETYADQIPGADEFFDTAGPQGGAYATPEFTLRHIEG